MPPTLPLLLAAALAGADAPKLDFASGKLTGWEGEGFAVVGRAATSADAGKPRKAILHRTFVLPPSASSITFTAGVMRPDGEGAGEVIDVVLEGTARRYAPREMRTSDGWVAAPQLWPPDGRKLREYRFDVERFAGRQVRLALIDSDERPGHHVIAAGFVVVTRDEVNGRKFASDVAKLQKEHGLPRFYRYDSKHFLAMSNAPAGDSEYRLYNCETIYATFFEHFRKRGFAARPPAEKMMVAIFGTQAGFDAYVGQSLGSAVTGLYHMPTNRLAVYDYATNKAFLEGKKRLDDAAKMGSSDLERERRTLVFGRHVRDRRDDTNVSTVMHEVAHQLSFNSGLLNRHGDVPAWLAEGLAVYCESTKSGAWQGIGEPNPQRALAIARQLRGGGELFTVRALAASDDWLRKAKFVDEVILGYSQSGALFRLLMEERPKQLKAYMQSIWARKTPDHRLADFAAAFGDMAKLEKRYQAYLREVVRKEVAAK
jgi:hypothetical protein